MIPDQKEAFHNIADPDAHPLIKLLRWGLHQVAGFYLNAFIIFKAFVIHIVIGIAYGAMLFALFSMLDGAKSAAAGIVPAALLFSGPILIPALLVWLLKKIWKDWNKIIHAVVLNVLFWVIIVTSLIKHAEVKEMDIDLERGNAKLSIEGDPHDPFKEDNMLTKLWRML